MRAQLGGLSEKMPAAQAAPPNSASEIEIKFRTDAEGLKLALASSALSLAEVPKPVLLRSIYFDTADGALRKGGGALRIRKRGRALPVMTFKAAASGRSGPFRRKEIEVRCPGLTPDLTLLDEATAAGILQLTCGQPLEAQFETSVRRRAALVRAAGSLVEAAFDEGYVLAGGRRLPLYEVELELKSGEEADLCDLASALVGEIRLRLDFVSKAEKGFRLAAGEVPRAVQAGPAALGPLSTFDEAVGAVIGAALAQFVENWAALRETEQAEPVHQMRVALRRMRAALAMFGRVLPIAEFGQFRAEAKRLASGLGPARECDAFRQNAIQGPLAPQRAGQAGSALLAAVESRRVAAYADARSLIDDPSASIFVLELRRFLARAPWRGAAPAGAPLMSAREFAVVTLTRLHTRVLKRGRRLAALSSEERHQLRIALKNLRYGADFFRSLFPRRRRARDYLGAAAALQEILGANNDAAAVAKFMAELPGATAADAARAAGFVLGWFASKASGLDDDLFASWKKFKKTEIFWR